MYICLWECGLGFEAPNVRRLLTRIYCSGLCNGKDDRRGSDGIEISLISRTDGSTHAYIEVAVNFGRSAPEALMELPTPYPTIITQVKCLIHHGVTK